MWYDRGWSPRRARGRRLWPAELVLKATQGDSYFALPVDFFFGAAAALPVRVSAANVAEGNVTSTRNTCRGDSRQHTELRESAESACLSHTSKNIKAHNPRHVCAR